MKIVSTKESWISIVSLSFNPVHKWRFYDGGSIFTANIVDDDFWQRIHRHEERFEEADQLLVAFGTVNERNKKGELHTVRSVEKVLNHVHVPKQAKLDM